MMVWEKGIYILMIKDKLFSLFAVKFSEKK